MSRAWYSGQHRRQAQQITCLMLRLVEQQTMETVCSHPLVVPVGDGIDVRVPERLERDAAAPMDPDSIDAFQARAEKHEDASDRCRPGAADEVPDKEIPERRECQRRPERVDEEDLIGCWRAAERTMLSGRQQVHQPVVVEVVVQVIRIPRRHVAFAELSDDGHLPDEIGGEIGPIGAPLRQLFADVRVGQTDDERDGEQDERAGAGIAAREARKGQRPCQPPHRQHRESADHGREHEQRDVAGAHRPQGEQPEAAQHIAPGRSGKKSGGDRSRLRSVEPPGEDDARQREPDEHRNENDAPPQRNKRVERGQERDRKRGDGDDGLFGNGWQLQRLNDTACQRPDDCRRYSSRSATSGFSRAERRAGR